MAAHATTKKRTAPRKTARGPRRISRAKSVGSLFVTALDFSDEEAASIFRRMLTIRRLDEALIKLTRRHGAPVTAAPGHEAIAVGACSVLKPADIVLGSVWRHGLLIARTASVAAAVSEWLPQVRMELPGEAAPPSCSVLDGGMSLAAGAALACRLNKQNEAVLCFCDATDLAKGSFHESMNLTTAWKLPIVYIFPELEVPRSSHRGRVLTQAQHYGIEGVLCDGSSVSDVRTAVLAALERARTGKGATLIEAAVPASKSPAQKVAAQPTAGDPLADIKSLRDPIRIFRNLLNEASLMNDDDAAAFERDVAAEVKTALSRLTEKSAAPAREALLKNVLKGWTEGKFGLMRS
jgi:TPP-dependent pyruvate/acetoin dehydrogenase alpha subunit